MQTIRFGKYVSVIEEGAVQWCHQLQSVQITSQLRFIGANAFEGCEQLQDINLPDSINYIGHAAFEHTALSTIRIPRSLTISMTGFFHGVKN